MVLKPVFEVADICWRAACPCCHRHAPLPVTLAALTPHRHLRDPKVTLFTDFIATHIKTALAEAMARCTQLPR
jgi:hypothetical protein